MPIVLLVFGLVWQKRGSLWELNLINCLPRKDESCWDVASLHNFWRWKLTANRAHWVDALLFCPQRPKWSWILPPHTWGETAIQHNEKLIHRWETKRFALLTSCWLPVELPLVLSLHAIMWLYGDGSVSKETTLEHFDSDICLALERIRSCCGTGESEFGSLSCLKVGYSVKLCRKSCSWAFFGWRWTSSDQGTTKSFI